jgi:hypothetical protein
MNIVQHTEQVRKQLEREQESQREARKSASVKSVQSVVKKSVFGFCIKKHT